MTLIGDDNCDKVLISEYPSIDAFLEMQRNKSYFAAVPYRTEALEDSRLIVIRMRPS